MNAWAILLTILSSTAVFSSCNSGDEGGEDTPKNNLSVNPENAITFEAKDNSDIVLTVTTDADIWDYTKPSWVTAKKNAADKTLTINAADNTAGERSGVIKFTAGNATPVEVNVSQKDGEGTEPKPEVRSDNLMVYMPFDDVNGWIEEGADFTPYDAGPYILWTTPEGTVGYLNGKKGKCFSSDNSACIRINTNSAETGDKFLTELTTTEIPGISVTAWVNPEWYFGANNVIFSFQNFHLGETEADNFALFWGTIDLAIKMDETTEPDGAGDPVYKIAAHLRNDRPLDKERDEWGQPTQYEYKLDKSYFESWHHIAFTYNCSSSTATLYVDGQKVDEQLLKEADKEGTPLETDLGQLKMYPTQYTRMSVGAWYIDKTAEPWTHFFRGKLDEVRVYTASLTAEEVDVIYKDVD